MVHENVLYVGDDYGLGGNGVRYVLSQSIHTDGNEDINLFRRVSAPYGKVKFNVTGNGCPHGKDRAIGECTNPVRSLTSIVRVSDHEDTMVSVKSAAPVPKGKMFEIMERIRAAQVEEHVAIGDVILSDVYGTEIVATKEIQ